MMYLATQYDPYELYDAKKPHPVVPEFGAYGIGLLLISILIITLYRRHKK